MNGRSGVIGLRGSFWADTGTLDLLRIEIHATEIPPELALLETDQHAIDYILTRVGAAEALLQRSAETRMTMIHGQRDLNRIRFTDCRQFSSESTIHYYSAESIIRYPGARPK